VVNLNQGPRLGAADGGVFLNPLVQRSTRVEPLALLNHRQNAAHLEKGSFLILFEREESR
jgi:hypothetical protein